MQDTLIYGGVALIIALLYASVFAACRAAGRYDASLEEMAAAFQQFERQRTCWHENTRLIDQAAVECLDCGREWPDGHPLVEAPKGMTRLVESGPNPTPVGPKPKRRTWGRE